MGEGRLDGEGWWVREGEREIGLVGEGRRDGDGWWVREGWR